VRHRSCRSTGRIRAADRLIRLRQARRAIRPLPVTRCRWSAHLPVPSGTHAYLCRVHALQDRHLPGTL